MQYRIVADSSANMFHLEGVDFASVPLKIITQEKEYVDTPALDVVQMVEELRAYKGKSGTSCPNVHDWLESFGDADCVFAIAITSNLSGSCNAARQAAQEYMRENLGKRVCVLDSLSAGPELRLIAEKVREGILAGELFEAIEAKTRQYMAHTHLNFVLQSLNNLARNGRVSPAAAKIAGVLGICVVGRASDVGTLQQEHKCRGEKRSLDTLYGDMRSTGYVGGKVRIAHCMNPGAAQQLAEMICADFPGADIEIEQCTALCSFYAEQDGLLVGYEDSLAD